jgi:hypothetical protein
MEANANEDSVKMNEKEGSTEMLVEIGAEEEGASVGPEIVVLLDGPGKVMVGTDDESGNELEGGTPTESEEEKVVGSGGAEEEESVGPRGALEEEEGGGRMLGRIEVRVLRISPGFDEEEGGGLEGLELAVSVTEGVLTT